MEYKVSLEDLFVIHTDGHMSLMRNIAIREDGVHVDNLYTFDENNDLIVDEDYDVYEESIPEVTVISEETFTDKDAAYNYADELFKDFL